MFALGKCLADREQWAITGLLHDADYEKHPDEHPKIITEILEERGEQEIAHAIHCHYTKWGYSCESLLDKALLACDELTGLVIAERSRLERVRERQGPLIQALLSRIEGVE